ncbi:hypothetical protein NPIL_9861, partial [Nephila pilipes]
MSDIHHRPDEAGIQMGPYVRHEALVENLPCRLRNSVGITIYDSNSSRCIDGVENAPNEFLENFIYLLDI